MFVKKAQPVIFDPPEGGAGGLVHPAKLYNREFIPKMGRHGDEEFAKDGLFTILKFEKFSNG